ncbi:23S rRNA (cytidine(2498)-2'-O)-methyltransferase RlmM [Marinobacter xestospongiae]|uniref:23S rRNA (Cytidine(2498)-2'-O)-methyltransferase RlmM n=1 Tax=Marinobacter xestospongiae TaxID=994319 RepID=A0ABU3VYL5_9GAMM|nr:23S rRNA (cytidine(2498)-2'-O)-methyltransferase RlmM [Marinobacter xestospongiae]MDV2079052.1 23S rRNA (cytidine(2498)-2'-O)-methyltransferase RlmM [Marinobacter xestospongiae]
MGRLVLFCRPGFETDAGRELTDMAAQRGCYGYFSVGPVGGIVEFHLSGGERAADLMARVSIDELVFTRDWIEVLTVLELPAEDRVGAVIEALRVQDVALPPCGRLEVRLPEGHDDGDLGRFARKWVAPLSKGLRGAGLMPADQDSHGDYRLEILLTGFDQAWVGISRAANRSRFLGGIPRLRLPASAPSRSALKLEEAWKVFFPEEQALFYLGGGKKAVDLGAAPGGWSWQLVRQGMMVTAVDNGPMQAELMASGQVQHVEADGYTWRPKRGVDWMVCDIVDHPRRTAKMAVSWVVDRMCRYTIFNLKLPMKKRYDEWLICRELIEEALSETELNWFFKASHLYHDREEITCFIERRD